MPQKCGAINFPRLVRSKGCWLGRELNPRHEDFQSSALPTELPSRMAENPRNIFRTPGCHYGGFSPTGKRRLAGGTCFCPSRS